MAQSVVDSEALVLALKLAVMKWYYKTGGSSPSFLTLDNVASFSVLKFRPHLANCSFKKSVPS